MPSQNQGFHHRDLPTGFVPVYRIDNSNNYKVIGIHPDDLRLLGVDPAAMGRPIAALDRADAALSAAYAVALRLYKPEIAEYVARGLTPGSAQAYLEAGLRPYFAARYYSIGLSAAEAAEWSVAGVSAGDTELWGWPADPSFTIHVPNVEAFRAAGYSPAKAGEWLRARHAALGAWHLEYRAAQEGHCNLTEAEATDLFSRLPSIEL